MSEYPLAELLHWRKHPFPEDIEAMILKLRTASPSALVDRITPAEYVDWAHGRNLEAGRLQLRALLAECPNLPD